MAVKSCPKVNKGMRWDRDTWLKFSRAALETGDNRSRLLNQIVNQWLESRKAEKVRS
jgi:hypothetical protein